MARKQPSSTSATWGALPLQLRLSVVADRGDNLADPASQTAMDSPATAAFTATTKSPAPVTATASPAALTAPTALDFRSVFGEQGVGRVAAKSGATGSPALGGFFPTLRAPVVAGIDEAGRGCLAGPVVAAAVILPESFSLPGLADSKVLAPSRRDGLAAAIGQCALAWGLGVIWPGVIDATDILQATLCAMSRAAVTLKIRPEALLIDGNQRIPDLLLRRAGFTIIPNQLTVVDGDARVPVISAASILAKSFRDQLMEKLDTRYPGYGFAVHKGYGTAEHRQALAQLGPCRMHRLTFRGVCPEADAAKAAPTGPSQGFLC